MFPSSEDEKGGATDEEYEEGEELSQETSDGWDSATVLCFALMQDVRVKGLTMIKYKLGGVRLAVSVREEFKVDVGVGTAHPTREVFTSTVFCLLIRSIRGVNRERPRRRARGLVRRSSMMSRTRGDGPTRRGGTRN